MGWAEAAAVASEPPHLAASQAAPTPRAAAAHRVLCAFQGPEPAHDAPGCVLIAAASQPSPR